MQLADETLNRTCLQVGVYKWVRCPSHVRIRRSMFCTVRGVQGVSHAVKCLMWGELGQFPCCKITCFPKLIQPTPPNSWGSEHHFLLVGTSGQGESGIPAFEAFHQTRGEELIYPPKTGEKTPPSPPGTGRADVLRELQQLRGRVQVQAAHVPWEQGCCLERVQTGWNQISIIPGCKPDCTGCKEGTWTDAIRLSDLQCSQPFLTLFSRIVACKLNTTTIKPEQVCNAWKWITNVSSLQLPAAGIISGRFSTFLVVPWLRTGLTHYENLLGENQSLGVQVTCRVWREEG